MGAAMPRMTHVEPSARLSSFESSFLVLFPAQRCRSTFFDHSARFLEYIHPFLLQAFLYTPRSPTQLLALTGFSPYDSIAPTGFCIRIPDAFATPSRSQVLLRMCCTPKQCNGAGHIPGSSLSTCNTPRHRRVQRALESHLPPGHRGSGQCCLPLCCHCKCSHEAAEDTWFFTPPPSQCLGWLSQMPTVPQLCRWLPSVKPMQCDAVCWQHPLDLPH